jgi:hypothetical protein
LALEADMSSSTRMMMITIGVLAIPAAAYAQSDPTCSASATQATGYTPGQPATSGPDGDRVAGAAKGAAAGAVVGEVQGDNSRGTDNMKDQHRENQAKSGAAAGMAVAGSRNRQERRDERQTSGDQQAAWQSSYDACMAAK